MIAASIFSQIALPLLLLGKKQLGKRFISTRTLIPTLVTLMPSWYSGFNIVKSGNLVVDWRWVVGWKRVVDQRQVETVHFSLQFCK